MKPTRGALRVQGEISLDWTLALKAALMGIVEGLTEFLPISSTGHLILAGSLLNFTGETAKVFEIAIQTGAMLAVIWEYRQRLLGAVRGLGSEPAAQRFMLNLLVAFIPAAVLGLLFGKIVKINNHTVICLPSCNMSIIHVVSYVSSCTNHLLCSNFTEPQSHNKVGWTLGISLPGD
jgi:undecaprenyl pyrophosphate phosphatase UppP